MISIIRVTLTKGQFTNRSHLRGWARSMYPGQSVPVQQQHRAVRAMSYCSQLQSPSAYVCTPRPASQAFFLPINDREFEVVIETFHQGHLLLCSESVVQVLQRRLAQSDMKARMEVSVQYPHDGQVYIRGEPSSIWSRLWKRQKENLALLFAAVVVAIIASFWLTAYLEEAVAVTIGLVLCILLQTFLLCAEEKGKAIRWRTHEG